jgi:hypothetical protein
METFTQPKITGYRQLGEAEVALMNEGKLRHHPQGTPPGPDASGLLPIALDQRWVSMGASDLQVGFMKLIRAIAKPATF